jgi:hypothetical protein
MTRSTLRWTSHHPSTKIEVVAPRAVVDQQGKSYTLFSIVCNLSIFLADRLGRAGIEFCVACNDLYKKQELVSRPCGYKVIER